MTAIVKQEPFGVVSLTMSQNDLHAIEVALHAITIDPPIGVPMVTIGLAKLLLKQIGFVE